MKNFINCAIILSLLIMINPAFAQPEIRFSESILPYKGGIIISNFGSEDLRLKPDEIKGYILYYKNGKLNEFIKSDGYLRQPTALTIYKNKLYVCNGENIVIYDLKNLDKKPDKILFDDNVKVLNDMAESGDMLYITATDKNTVYRIKLKDKILKPEKWIDIPSPNGIVFDKNSAYITSIPADYTTPTADNVIYFVKDKNKPTPEKFNNIPRLYDGLALSKDKKSLYVSDWAEAAIFEINLKTKQEKTIYFEKGLTPADIGIKDNKLLIPDMTKHRIIILDLKTGKTKII